MKGGRCQDNASQEGGDEGESVGVWGEGMMPPRREEMKVRVWECGGEGMGEGWMTPRLCLPGGGR